MIEYNLQDLDIVHFDVYRINNEDSLYDIGFYDYIDAPGLTLIEWANLIPNALPKNCLFYEINHDTLDTRFVSIYTMKDGEKIMLTLTITTSTKLASLSLFKDDLLLGSISINVKKLIQ